MHLRDFHRGWQNKARPDLMRKDAVGYAKDVRVDLLGSIVPRRLDRESAVFGGGGFGSQIRDVFMVYVEGASRRLVFYVYDGSLWCWNSATRQTREVLKGVNESKRFSYAVMKPQLSEVSYVYGTNGVSMFCDNGVKTKTWGIDAPGSLVEVSMQGSGGMLSAGSYRYVYTFYDNETGAESGPSVESAAVVAVLDDRAELTEIERSTNARVTSRRVYRTYADGGHYYLNRTVNDNWASSVGDPKADTDLGQKLDMGKVVPPRGSLVVNHGNRLFLSGSVDYPNRVWFSEGSQPDEWTEDGYLEVGSADDKIRAMVGFDGKLFFIHGATITGLYGNSKETYAWHETRAHVGTVAHRSVAVGPDGVYFLASDGVYLFDGLKTVRISEPIDGSFGLTPSEWVETIDWASVADQACGVFLLGSYLLLVPMKTSEDGVVQRVLVYDSEQKVWVSYGTEFVELFEDKGSNKVYGSRLKAPGDWRVYEVYCMDSGTESDLDVEVVTRSVSIPEEIGGQAHQDRGVWWVRKFRVDALGSWRLRFYVDGQVVCTVSVIDYGPSDRYKWVDFPPKIKGRLMRVQVKAIGNVRPLGWQFNGLEVV